MSKPLITVITAIIFGTTLVDQLPEGGGGGGRAHDLSFSCLSISYFCPHRTCPICRVPSTFVTPVSHVRIFLFIFLASQLVKKPPVVHAICWLLATIMKLMGGRLLGIGP